jgi:hypothetical protein
LDNQLNTAIGAFIKTIPILAFTFWAEHNVIRETPIPKAKRSGIGKLNNPAKRRV